MNSPRHNALAAHHRVKQKQEAAALQQTLARFDPEYIAKLKHDALVAANAELRGADATVIVRAAQDRFEAYVKFLTEKQA